MSNTKILELPDIRDAVYATSGRLEATRLYLNMLKDYSSLDAKLLHNKLETDYLRYISSNKLKKQTEKIVSRIHCHAVRNFPNYSLTAKSREKALLSYVHKNLIALSDGKPLDHIMDTRACRLIIDSVTDGPEELIKTLGNLVNTTILFLLDQGFQLYPAPKPKDTAGFNVEKYPDIYIPKKSYILPEYKMYVKDYVSTPKATNGYQSFHVIVIDPDGNPLEIQFRTFDMDCHSENKIDDHYKYKEKKVQKYSLPVLDRSRVHWSNYRYEIFYAPNKNNVLEEKIMLEDYAGLEKSVSIRSLVYNP